MLENKYKINKKLFVLKAQEPKKGKSGKKKTFCNAAKESFIIVKCGETSGP